MTLTLIRTLTLTFTRTLTTTPTLTTVHVPVEEIGVRVADYLLGCIEGRAMPMKTELEANLVLRDSTARVRTAPVRTAAG